MRMFLAILACKVSKCLLKLIGRGSSLPGGFLLFCKFRYFSHIFGEGVPWHTTSTVTRLSYSFPKKDFNP